MKAVARVRPWETGINCSSLGKKRKLGFVLARKTNTNVFNTLPSTKI